MNTFIVGAVAGVVLTIFVLTVSHTHDIPVWFGAGFGLGLGVILGLAAINWLIGQIDRMKSTPHDNK
ncbi:MAG TPA: hypothetical protein VNI20_13855 [Fimbriimonadaceae bacterium]|nr:hypothetical protein [Fimbriimonadaceae bacterium]